MLGNSYWEEFLAEIEAKQAEWEPQLRGLRYMRSHADGPDVEAAIDAMIIRYERRLSLMGGGEVIRLRELIEDGYPEMAITEVSASVYDLMVQHQEEQAEALRQFRVASVHVLVANNVHAIPKGESV